MSRGARRLKNLAHSTIGLVPSERPTDLPPPARSMGLRWERLQLAWPRLSAEHQENLALIAEKYVTGEH